MDTNFNRVYVNPNFNRVPSSAIQYTDSLHTNNHLYINPNFTRNTDVQQFTNVKRKIYVNPNFIKSSNTLDICKLSKATIQVDYSTKSLEHSHSSISRPNVVINVKSKIIDSPRPSSKSRYRLVRKNDNKVSEKAEQKIIESCTVKVNKYKSIPLHKFKNNLQVVKNESVELLKSSKSNTSISASRNVDRNKFKLVKQKLKSPINIFTPKALKIKRNIELKSQIKLKNVYGTRKKNNIPCRLFTKYGKCLRNLYGTCEYLHDKKHVSLCRKFIKGICHDKQCPLSHELSTKKMPTCYFYLKGMCTKDDCPYLHVKLNEKSKICPEFLKGYCDKGDMCLYRHVLQSTSKSNEKAKHYASNVINNKTQYKNLKVNISKTSKTNELKRLRMSTESKNNKTSLEKRHNEQNMNKEKDDADCRYFKDLQNKEPICEVLKPTRCKLGTLPSFISL